MLPAADRRARLESDSGKNAALFKNARRGLLVPARKARDEDQLPPEMARRLIEIGIPQRCHNRTDLIAIWRLQTRRKQARIPPTVSAIQIGSVLILLHEAGCLKLDRETRREALLGAKRS